MFQGGLTLTCCEAPRHLFDRHMVAVGSTVVVLQEHLQQGDGHLGGLCLWG